MEIFTSTSTPDAEVFSLSTDFQEYLLVKDIFLMIAFLLIFVVLIWLFITNFFKR